MNKTNHILLALSLKNNGDWNKIYQDISNKNLPTEQELERAKNFNGNYITIMDKEYPDSLKNTFHPPFVLFYEGNIELLKKREKSMAIQELEGMGMEETKTHHLVLDKIPQDTLIVLSGTKRVNTKIIWEFPKFNFIQVKDYLIPSTGTSKENLLVLSDKYGKNEDEYSNYQRIVSALANFLLVFRTNHKENLIVMDFAQAGKEVVVLPTSIRSKLENNKLIGDGATIYIDNETLEKLLEVE